VIESARTVLLAALLISPNPRSISRTLKPEFFHHDKVASIEELQAGLRHNHHYNPRRLKSKLVGLSPLQCRIQTLR